MNKQALITIIREEVKDAIKERNLTEKKFSKKEKIITALKKKLIDFKKRQGTNAKESSNPHIGQRAHDFAKLNEKEMTKSQIDDRERIADRLLKKKSEFKSKYGEDWENVLHATATKMAMEENKNAS